MAMVMYHGGKVILFGWISDVWLPEGIQPYFDVAVGLWSQTILEAMLSH